MYFGKKIRDKTNILLTDFVTKQDPMEPSLDRPFPHILWFSCFQKYLRPIAMFVLFC